MTLTAERHGALEAPLEHEIDPQLQEQLLQHPGKWAAITRTDLIALGESPAEVMELARAAGFEAPILYRVPKGGESYFF
jgi:hypothetical protein